MVNDRLCANIIEQENCTQKLTELLKSTDEGIGKSAVTGGRHPSSACFLATYAAAVLFRLAEDKPNELKKRLSQDVTSALYRDEHFYGNPYRSTPTSTMTDGSTMNYYTSEGPGGSGLVENATNGQMGAWYDTDL